jgi:hypothetical protein
MIKHNELDNIAIGFNITKGPYIDFMRFKSGSGFNFKRYWIKSNLRRDRIQDILIDKVIYFPAIKDHSIRLMIKL